MFAVVRRVVERTKSYQHTNDWFRSRGISQRKENMSTNVTTTEPRDLRREHQVVSQEDWTEARKELLSKEKKLTRLRDQLAVERRALPWVKVEKDYFFDAPEGRVTLAGLFAGRNQVVVYHFMFG